MVAEYAEKLAAYKSELPSLHKALAVWRIEQLAAHKSELPSLHKALVAWRKEQNRHDAQFKADAIADVFGDDAYRFPATVEKLWSIAHDNGHSDGHMEIYMQLSSFTAVIAAVMEDVEKCNTEYKAVITRLSIRCAEAEICASVDNAQVAAIVSRIEDEKITALRLEVSSLKETIATLSTHIANSMDDGEEWLSSYTAIVEIKPQPTHTTGDWWMYGDLPYTSDELRSHLFHQVYGNSEGNSTVMEECHPVLVDGVWYWKEGEAV